MTLRRATPIGPLLENCVLGELGRQLTWTEEPVRLYLYRDRDGYDVDAILEHAAGEVVAVEVKAAEPVRAEDLRGCSAGSGTNCWRVSSSMRGALPLPFGDRLRARPISALWAR